MLSRTLLSCLFSLALSAAAVAAPIPPLDPIPQFEKNDVQRNFTPIPVQGSACCKICRKGKPCGNSCISRDKTCHKGKGCACQG